ncbi:MAG TPA: phosphatase domain-containing protein [Bacteriovoracaceae bacterium]|nr:phosphatase domain-containing protein [Bacteriovoracaceae bacterium]
MKKYILSLLVLISLSSVEASISIVSDLDDTIKITNSGQQVDRTINAFFTGQVFTGIPEFYQGTRAYAGAVHVVSASPTVLRSKILTTLHKKNIKIDSLTLKSLVSRETKLVYKVKAITKIMEASSDDFILIGDDVGQDPEVYDALLQLYPNRILGSYIHVINGRKIPESSVPYYSTFDLLLREYAAGRMAKEAVEKGVELLKKESKMELIFPFFAQCPKTPAVWLWQVPTVFVTDALALTAKFNLHCLARRSSN